jgi:hypothetical protein|tara:strand:- start:208 stop:567 length:360 start_codon:yes stop_codon:yes gene_type:complete
MKITEYKYLTQIMNAIDYDFSHSNLECSEVNYVNNPIEWETLFNNRNMLEVDLDNSDNMLINSIIQSLVKKGYINYSSYNVYNKYESIAITELGNSAMFKTNINPLSYNKIKIYREELV